MGSVFVRSRPLSKNMHGKCWLHATMLEVEPVLSCEFHFFWIYVFQNLKLLKLETDESNCSLRVSMPLPIT